MTKHTLTILAAIVLVASAAHAREIVDKERGFRITIPDDFEDFPASRMRPYSLHGYISYSYQPDEYLIIAIDSIGGTISRKQFTQESLEADTKADPAITRVQVYETKWKGHTITGMDARATIEGVPSIVRNAQVPLRPEAIQITVSGPVAVDAQITEVLEQILGTLEGESNWDDGPDQSISFERRAEAMAYALAHAMMPCIGIVFVIILLRRATSNSKKEDAQAQSRHEPAQQQTFVDAVIVDPNTVAPVIIEPSDDMGSEPH